MYATEFKTIIKGLMIKIPDYEHFKNKSVRVIILEEEPEEQNILKMPDKEDFISRLSKSPRHVPSDIVFLSRDDANAR